MVSKQEDICIQTSTDLPNNIDSSLVLNFKLMSFGVEIKDQIHHIRIG